MPTPLSPNIRTTYRINLRDVIGLTNSSEVRGRKIVQDLAVGDNSVRHGMGIPATNVEFADSSGNSMGGVSWRVDDTDPLAKIIVTFAEAMTGVQIKILGIL